MRRILLLTAVFYLSVASCHRPKSGAEEMMKTADSVQTSDANRSDSFIVVYRQPVNGYMVKAAAKLVSSDVPIISADLIFTKDGKSFTLHTQCFGDTLYSKGRLDYDGENQELFKKHCKKVVNADYHENKEEKGLPIRIPFFFKDMDFDGIAELVIVHYSMAARYGSGYDVYRIVDGTPRLIDYPPYYDNKDRLGFGMTNYPEVDSSKKTISCPYPEGEMKYEGCKVYGVSKKQKDTVTVNGRKHFFNHLELIKEIKYGHNE